MESKNKIKEKYAQAIQILFDGAIEVLPDQINDEIMLCVDRMILDIAHCSKNITAFAFDTFYQFVFAHFTQHALQYALNKINPSHSLLSSFIVWLGAEYSDNQLSDSLSEWVATLARKRQFIGCVYTARLKWRSRIELELNEW